MNYSMKLVLAAAMLAMGSQAYAEEYPARAVKMVVPFAAGGVTDVVSRVIAKEMSEKTGQPVIVENKPGAGGSLGASLVSKAPADGYTLLVSNNGNMAANKFLYKEMGYDPEQDFKHLSILFSVPYMIISSEQSGITSITDLIEKSKLNDGKLSMANGGYGTAVHLMAESFSHVAGLNITHIPYKGEAPAVTDVLGGHTPLGISSYSSIAQHMASKKINALAVTSKERLSILPDVPTLSELGFELAVREAWFGIAAPKDLDPQIADELQKTISSSMSSNSVTEKVDQLGGTVVNANAAQAAEFISTEIPRWGTVIRQANIQPN